MGRQKHDPGHRKARAREIAENERRSRDRESPSALARSLVARGLATPGILTNLASLTDADAAPTERTAA